MLDNDSLNFADPSVTLFREYLRIKSVHPQPDYAGCVVFLKKLGEEYGLKYDTFEVNTRHDILIFHFQIVPGKPFVLLTWEGTNPALPTVVLNSHMDVVPVYMDKWKYDPFEAHKDEEGNIFARGTQDMKCVGIQYLQAVHRLKKAGYTPLRTIHLLYVPGKEISSLIRLIDRYSCR